MSYTPNNPNGQATMANSAPVVIASNQSAIPVSDTDISGKVGPINETAPASDTASSGLNGRMQRVAQNITAANTNAPKSPDTDNATLTNTKVLPVGGRAIDVTVPTTFSVGDAAMSVYDNSTGAQVVLQGDLNSRYDTVTLSEAIRKYSLEITRPANTTAYAAEDMIWNTGTGSIDITVTPSLLTTDASGYIVGARIITNDTGAGGVLAKTTLLIYDTAGSISVTDNAVAVTGTYTLEKNKIARIDFDTLKDSIGDPVSNDAWECELKDLRIPYKLALSTNFRMVLVTRDVFTPVSGSNFYVEIILSTNP